MVHGSTLSSAILPNRADLSPRHHPRRHQGSRSHPSPPRGIARRDRRRTAPDSAPHTPRPPLPPAGDTVPLAMRSHAHHSRSSPLDLPPHLLSSAHFYHHAPNADNHLQPVAVPVRTVMAAPREDLRRRLRR
jgi:hypothetical protein